MSPINLEARIERVAAQVEALDTRFDQLGVQQRCDLDEMKLMIERFTREAASAEAVKSEKWEKREDRTNERVQALEFWRWMMFGAFSVLTVIGGMTWYFTSNLMLDEIRNIRTHMRIPAPAGAK